MKQIFTSRLFILPSFLALGLSGCVYSGTPGYYGGGGYGSGYYAPAPEPVYAPPPEPYYGGYGGPAVVIGIGGGHDHDDHGGGYGGGYGGGHGGGYGGGHDDNHGGGGGQGHQPGGVQPPPQHAQGGGGWQHQQSTPPHGGNGNSTPQAWGHH